jgi:general stress protein 26
MSLCAIDEDGSIWFIRKKSGEKNKEIASDGNVRLFYESN